MSRTSRAMVEAGRKARRLSVSLSDDDWDAVGRLTDAASCGAADIIRQMIRKADQELAAKGKKSHLST